MTEDVFVFNHDNITNSYGFRILSSGIDLKRFRKNPICLNQHRNDTKSVLGKWTDVKLDGVKLIGKPVFDTEDAEGKEVVRKVNAGVINACSVGVSFNENYLERKGNELILAKCELFEVSIVAIPSNSNAVKLYHSDTQELMSNEAVIQLLQVKNTKINKKENMPTESITLSPETIIALGLNEKIVNQASVDKAVRALKNKATDLELKLTSAAEKLKAYVKKEDTNREKTITDMIDLAIREGRINGAQKEAYLILAKKDVESTKTALEGLPKKKDLSKTKTPTGGGVSMDDFQKMTLEQQLDFKSTNPEGYKNLLS